MARPGPGVTSTRPAPRISGSADPAGPDRTARLRQSLRLAAIMPLIASCSLRSPHTFEVSSVDRKTSTERRQHELEGSVLNEGSARVIFKPERTCVSTTPVTTTRIESRLKKMESAGLLIGLGIATYGAATYKQAPDSELTQREFAIQKNVSLGALALLDLGIVISFINAVRDTARPKEIVRAGRTSVRCSEACALPGKEAYLNVELDRQRWCLPLGRIGRSNEIVVAPDKVQVHAQRLPPRARRIFESMSLDAHFLHGEIVVPACGDRNDCSFWEPLLRQ